MYGLEFSDSHTGRGEVCTIFRHFTGCIFTHTTKGLWRHNSLLAHFFTARAAPGLPRVTSVVAPYLPATGTSEAPRDSDRAQAAAARDRE